MLAEILLSCIAAVPVVPPADAPRPSAFLPAPLGDEQQAATCLPDVPDRSSNGNGGNGGSPTPADPPAALVEPVPAAGGSPRVEWQRLGRNSGRFLAIMHAFRWATEPGTRSGGFGLGSGYVRSITNMHGWSDGDPFYVNYVGHPIQAAVSGRLFLLSDPRFDRTEFGRNREYWKGKLRATAFAWAFSEQFELGPLSEASIGHIQMAFPQQGFEDHVITPTIGLGWMIGEDALDRFVVRAIEDRTTNKWVRLTLRTALNPARSFANLVDGRAPWHRASRAGVLSYRPGPPPAPILVDRGVLTSGAAKAAPFEAGILPGWRQFAGRGCMGAGAEAAYRVAPDLQLALAVNGCRLLDLPANLSGDALVYQVGPRWTPSPAARWSPFAHVLVGGIKITQEQLFPEKKLAVERANLKLDPQLAYTLHDQYTRRAESNGVAISAGTGVDYRLNAALAFRVASVEYMRTTAGTLGGLPYSNGLQVTMGMLLRLGTW